MRDTGTTMISRDSIVYPTMEGGSKGEIKEGSPRRSPGDFKSYTPATGRGGAYCNSQSALQIGDNVTAGKHKLMVVREGQAGQ